MSAVIGWGLAVAAVAAGYMSYRWQGVVFAITLVAFWLLLQFSRALRVMRAAAGKPVGSVDNAVMLQAKLHQGMRLMDIIKLTRSLGTPVRDDPETFRWFDASGDAVLVEMKRGKVARVMLERVPPTPAP